MDFSHHPTFDWLKFPEGRARLSGGVRGIMDEQGHDTFSVEVNGQAYFGEIKNAFLPNGNDYNIKVISFGYGSEHSIGMPMPGSCQIFTEEDANSVRKLVAQLIFAGAIFLNKPTLLTEYPDAHFMGKVIFSDGWILVANGRAAA